MKTRRRGVPGAGWALSWLVLLAAGMPLGLPSLTAAAAVTVVSPNGLQRWEAGATRKILFSATDVSQVRIELSGNAGGSWSEIAAAAAAAGGSYLWPVPETPGDAFLIRVSDAGDAGISDQSDETFAIVPPITGDEFDHVFFSDSLTPDYYDPSWTFVNAPSTLVRYGTKIPVTTARSLVGNYALSLAWSSRAGGDWGAAVASIGWIGHDATQRDSLAFHIFCPEGTAQGDLPCIYLEDLANAKTAKLPLAGMMGDVAAGAWQRVTIPLQAFADNPGNADLTRVKTIFFGQQTADGAPHRWYLDDIRMTGGYVVTGEDVPLIVVLGSSTAAGAGASLPDSSWVGRYRAHLAGRDSTAVVVNLAVGGYTTYHIMPTGHIPPPGRPYPSAGHNITMALAYRPWAIIVNLPSNDVASGYSIAEQLANYETVKGLAEDARAPIWFTTAQPRNFASQAMRDALRAMTDSTFARYGDFAIDFWHGLAAADGTILPQYNSGDGIHLNNAGHRLLYERVAAAGVWEYAVLTGIEEPAQGENEPAPRRQRLHQNVANPFNPRTRIGFELSSSGPVELAVYDLRGRLVRRLARGLLPAQQHAVVWDGRDEAGRPVAGGAYLCRLRTSEGGSARRMVLLR